MHDLTDKLEEVEKDISGMESKLPERLDSNKTDLENTKKKMEEFKVNTRNPWLLNSVKFLS